VVPYLSPEWIEAIDRAARGVAADPDVSVTLQVRVDGGPSGDVAYAVVVADGTVGVTSGEVPGASVVLTQAYETAVAVATGRTNALEALQQGDIAIEGDADGLRAAQPALTALDTAAAGVRAETSF
jgi:putative sterol carrier protein